MRLSAKEVEEATASLPEQVVEDIIWVQDQVRSFAAHQLASMRDFEVETLPGVRLGQRHIPVGAVGAYIPAAVTPHGLGAYDDRHGKGRGVGRVMACTPPIRGQVRRQP